MKRPPYQLYALLILLLFTGSCVLSNQQTPALDPYFKQAPPCFNCGVVLNGHVTRVLDGDTLEVNDQNHHMFRIRLQGIDAPEKSQAYGSQAKEFLTKLTLNHDVEIIWNEKDQYGRLIGKITSEQKDVCLEMISAGLAWHFTKYEQTQSEEDRQLYKATEKRVREQRKGLWADPNPRPPWEYRQQQRQEQQKQNFEFMSKNGKNNGGPKTDDERVDLTLRQMEETAQYQALTDLELITATIADSISDDPRVHELMSRLNPDWTEDISDTRDPLRPSHVSLSLPINVARTAVAFDHCRCAAEGNTDPNYSPCLYCALRASIYRATKDPDFSPEPPTT